ncbi:MAG TPA: hypothetical protein VL860_09190 [Planctomycetota bacterium]|nr:hypothetical protein [Planctomycetota bacterium]
MAAIPLTVSIVFGVGMEKSYADSVALQSPGISLFSQACPHYNNLEKGWPTAADDPLIH